MKKKRKEKKKRACCTSANEQNPMLLSVRVVISEGVQPASQPVRRPHLAAAVAEHITGILFWDGRGGTGLGRAVKLLMTHFVTPSLLFLSPHTTYSRLHFLFMIFFPTYRVITFFILNARFPPSLPSLPLLSSSPLPLPSPPFTLSFVFPLHHIFLSMFFPLLSPTPLHLLPFLPLFYSLCPFIPSLRHHLPSPPSLVYPKLLHGSLSPLNPYLEFLAYASLIYLVLRQVLTISGTR